MTPIEQLVAEMPDVITEGIGLFDSALDAQAVSYRRVEWRPPPPGVEVALASLVADPRTNAANAKAVERMLGARPHLVDVLPAADALPILREGVFLHAGPPIAWADASGPLRGAIVGALLYEGRAATTDEAFAQADRGDVLLQPCHDHNAVGPMAGVVSPSMPVLRVEDFTSGHLTYCTLNEGLGTVLRYGAFGPSVIERLRWMESVLGPMIRDALHRCGPLDLRSMIAHALQMGDEGHNRNRAGTSLFLRAIVAELVEIEAPSADISAILRFIDANDHFFLNPVMAACKAVADAGRDVPNSSVVVAMARNGTEFGVQTAGTGSTWFTAPAAVPDGLYLGEYTVSDANPDIGDSTITETTGIGGMAMAAAPAIVRFVGGTSTDAMTATRRMYDITLSEHDVFLIPALEFRGTPFGIDVTKVVRTGVVPIVNTGIAGRIAGTGQVGAGLVRLPLAAFVQAVHALARTAQPPWGRFGSTHSPGKALPARRKPRR